MTPSAGAHNWAAPTLANARAGAHAAALPAATSSSLSAEEAAAAAAELEKVGYGRFVIDEVLARPTTTRVIVRAAILEGATKPTRDRRMGLTVKLIRNPGMIGPGFLKRAESELAPKPPPAPAAPLPVVDDGQGRKMFLEALRQGLQSAQKEGE